MSRAEHLGNSSRMWRLVLARCEYDSHAEQLVGTECHDRWREIADGLLEITALLLADRSGAGLRFVERQIDLAMYCEQRDRDELPLDLGIIARQLAIWDNYEQESAA
ncbi:hypothetical protein [Mycobacterium sp.]|uniref:hypothetical protein n=1 Tax=Mycobacterium sp. TaxID=1785 RepID=UPI003F973499